MRGRPAVLALSVALVACASSEPSRPGEVTGVVTAGPTCPVETIASPCPPAPWEGTVRATAADGSTFEARTDPDGAFVLVLPPGHYVVSAVTGSGGPPMAVPVDVTVSEDGTQRVDLTVDTGIR